MHPALSILVLSVLRAGTRTSSPEIQAVPQTSGLFEVVRSWKGGVNEHLGIGLSALGDVDGDGHPDFILGKMTGAYTFAFGPGAGCVISGADGSQLYEVCGTDKKGGCGDAFGDTLASLGDLDGDGAPDFAVGAWRYEGYVGYVTVYSGRNGEPLATIYGEGTTFRGQGPVPPKTCESGPGAGFGALIVGLADLDGDSVRDFAVGDGTNGGQSLISGASLALIGSLPGLPFGMTGDFDGDGHPDIACIVLGTLSSGLRIVSGVSRLPLMEFAIGEDVVSSTVAGDVDGDSFVDLFVVKDTRRSRSGGSWRVEPIEVRWMSGKTGEVLHSLALDPGGYAGEVDCSPMGVVDGDERPEVLMQTFRRGVGSRLWILDGRTGTVLAEDSLPSCTEARKFVRVGDVDGDGRIEFLVSDYESMEGVPCGGAVHLVRLRPSGK